MKKQALANLFYKKMPYKQRANYYFIKMMNIHIRKRVCFIALASMGLVHSATAALTLTLKQDHDDVVGTIQGFLPHEESVIHTIGVFQPDTCTNTLLDNHRLSVCTGGDSWIDAYEARFDHLSLSKNLLGNTLSGDILRKTLSGVPSYFDMGLASSNLGGEEESFLIFTFSKESVSSQNALGFHQEVELLRVENTSLESLFTGVPQSKSYVTEQGNELLTIAIATPSSVPEPSSSLLALLGSFSFFMRRNRLAGK